MWTLSQNLTDTFEETVPYPTSLVCPKCGRQDRTTNTGMEFECPCGARLWKEPPLPYSDRDAGKVCHVCGTPVERKAAHGPFICDACSRKRKYENWKKWNKKRKGGTE